MDISLLVETGAILVLVLANGFFALSEFSIIASSRSKLQRDIEDHKKGAERAQKLYEKPDKFLASVQVGITLFGTLAGVFGGATIVLKIEHMLAQSNIEFVASAAGPIAMTLVALGITVLAVVIGELVPKYIALSNPERYARMVAPPISIFVKLSSFVATTLSWVSNKIARLFGVKKGISRDHITEDDINQMIFQGRKDGVFDPVEERLIKSVFEFADSTVRRAMTPRTDVIGIDQNATSDCVIDTIAESEYSRYPIYKDNLDNIVGILFAKDIIIQKISPDLIVLKDLCREPMFIPDSMPLSKLLADFQNKKKHIAIVLDEYGGTAGIITLEDILEELVGEIQDEYDEEQDPLVKHSDKVAYADGSVWVGAINELMNSKLPEGETETIAGLVIDELGRVPGKNEKIRIADMEITILESEKNRLSRLKLVKIKSSRSRTDNSDEGNN